jgi:hypothetical protein
MISAAPDPSVDFQLRTAAVFALLRLRLRRASPGQGVRNDNA